jgi:hypothetical protein
VLTRSQLRAHITSTSTGRTSMQPRLTAEFDGRNRLSTLDIPVVMSRLHVKEWRVKQTTPLYVLARSQLGTHRTSTSTIRRSMQPRSTAEFDRRNRLTTSDIPRNVCMGRHQRACTVRACTKRTTQHTYACLSVHAQVFHLYSNTPPHSACRVPHYSVRHIPSYQRRSQTSPFLGPW